MTAHRSPNARSWPRKPCTRHKPGAPSPVQPLGTLPLGTLPPWAQAAWALVMWAPLFACNAEKEVGSDATGAGQPAAGASGTSSPGASSAANSAPGMPSAEVESSGVAMGEGASLAGSSGSAADGSAPTNEAAPTSNTEESGAGEDVTAVDDGSSADAPASDPDSSDPDSSDPDSSDPDSSDPDSSDPDSQNGDGAEPGVEQDPEGPDPMATAQGDAALEALAEHLEQPRDARAPIEQQDFAAVPLSAAQAVRASDLLWQDFSDWITETRSAEHEARNIVLGELELRYDFTIFGEAPAEGRSLFISLHGGGNAEASVNDQQWENQKQLYQPAEGIYLSPRAPTNTWNLWHEAHVDEFFTRLITNLIVLEGVNPDRVYVMGYSAGGDGVYQLGPRMADHWAAASAMAGHPNEASPLSLRNLGFTIHVGELDTAYDRNLVAVDWRDQLDALEAADPEGYPHVVEVHAGKPHWMDLEDAVAVPWMAEFTRDPVPESIVWYQDDITHGRSYWLSVDSPAAGTIVRAQLGGQRIDVQSEDVEPAAAALRVRLRDDMLDLDQPVTLSFNGEELPLGVVPRTIAVLSRTLDERGDPRLVFSAEATFD